MTSVVAPRVSAAPIYTKPCIVTFARKHTLCSLTRIGTTGGEKSYFSHGYIRRRKRQRQQVELKEWTGEGGHCLLANLWRGLNLRPALMHSWGGHLTFTIIFLLIKEIK